MEMVKEVSEKGIEDELDPPCVQLFQAAVNFAVDIQQRVKAELKGHMSKNKWG